MSPHRRRRSVRRAVLTVAVAGIATTALSGCGVGEEQVRPGVAAQVGNVSIGLDEVDDSAESYCEMITALVEDGATTAIPGSLVNDETLRNVVLRELADQLAEAYDVEAGDYYRGRLEETEAQLTQLGVDGALLDEVLPLISSGGYFLDIVQQVGRLELGPAAAADASDQTAAAEGLRVAQEWENEIGLEVNPRYADMHIGDIEQYVRVQTEDLSVPVSQFAKDAAAAGDAASPDAAFAESLPESQRCG